MDSLISHTKFWVRFGSVQLVIFRKVKQNKPK
jgi:hypothetical protein